MMHKFVLQCATSRVVLRMKKLRKIYYIFIELYDNLCYAKDNKYRLKYFREFMCSLGLHWPVGWYEYAHSGSVDPPLPPEPDFCCLNCGKIKEPYRAIFWRIIDGKKI
jgi:hypothetical protein